MNSPQTMEMPALRLCLRVAIDEIVEAAEYLDAAATAHLSNDPQLAADLIKKADIPAITAWADSMWGSNSEYNRHWKIDGAAPAMIRTERDRGRMPTKALQAALHARVGYHCRFCGIPVIRTEIRAFLVQKYPDAARWGLTNASKHAALHAMKAQYDHLLAHSRGGTSDLENLVVTCGPCNFGRGSHTLEEVRLIDPKTREPIRSDWDGLERLLKVSSLKAN